MRQSQRDTSIVRDAEGNPKPETRSWVYYDSQLLTVAGGALAANTQHTLFVIPQGGAGNGYAAKSFTETNMVAARQIAANHFFQIKAISFEIVPQVTVAPAWPTYGDVASLVYRSNFQLTVINKEMLRVPTAVIGGGSGVFQHGLAAATIATNGWPHASNRFFLDVPINLGAVAQFQVDLYTTTAWAAAPTVQFAYRVGLWGLLERPAQ